MQYIIGMQSYQSKNPTAITLGKFDGLHKGHELLVNKVMEYRETHQVDSVVFAFDMAPLFQKTGKEKKGLLTNEERVRLLNHRVDYLIECPFDESVSNIEAEDFIRDVLVEQFHARYIVVGTDFHFGHEKRGDFRMLEQYSSEYGYHVEVIEKKCYHGREISSTYVKEALSEGNMQLVQKLLGYPYTVSGKVVHGRKLGRTIGIPTMNIRPPKDKMLPPNGVYASKIKVDGQWYEGICNIGIKPTVVSEGEVLLESYLFDYQKDAYGKEISVQLFDFERAEEKFHSVCDLKACMEKDIEYSKKYFDRK